MSRISRILPPRSGWLLLSLLMLVALAPGAWISTAQAIDADHLIITEVVTTTRPVSGGRLGSEFIEVVNPTGGDIDMSNVYLTDGTFASGSVFYWNIADGTPSAATTGGGLFNDFHVRFPDGYVLAAGDTLAISVNGSAQYFEAYGQLPDFELYEDANSPDTVPEMVAVFPGSVNGGSPLGEINSGFLPSLSDNSESLILYTWDGSSDLVADLDFVFWGTDTNVLFDKTGVTVGAETYLADTAPGSQIAASASAQNFGQAYARVSADEGVENSPGNGLTGHDETSEDLGVTWATTGTQNPPMAPAVHFAAAPIFTAGMQEPAAPHDGQNAFLSVTALSNSAVTGVDFLYTINDGAPLTLVGTDAGDGIWTATLAAQTVGAVVVWYAMATNADGGTAVWPAAAPTFSGGWTVGEAPTGAAVAHKLLITEVSTGDNIFPYTGRQQIAMEFVEIHNPNAFTVDMSNYYLTDAINFDSQVYWLIANGPPHAPGDVGGGNFNDFTARFPDGYAIGAGESIVMSIGGSTWFDAFFGFLPDLELYNDDTTDDGVPQMRPVFDNDPGDVVGNSIFTAGRDAGSDDLPRGIPELEEFFGEPLILYHWNEGEPLVTDVDIFMWVNDGFLASNQDRVGFNKTGQVIGGAAYLPDTPVLSQSWFMDLNQDGNVSYSRIDDTEGDQLTSGSNGVGGRDETSEDWAVTFEQGPFSPGRFGDGGFEDLPALLTIPAKTFIPSLGERFPIQFQGPLDSEIKLRLFDMEGRLVLTLFDSRFDSFLPGLLNRVFWDGLDNTFQPVHAGMYIAHLSVVDIATGKEQSKTAPVVIATRLSK